MKKITPKQTDWQYFLSFGKNSRIWAKNSGLLKFFHILQKLFSTDFWLFTPWLQSPISLWKLSIPMKDTSAKIFNFNLNLDIKIIRTRYQYQYQYCRTHNSISISIPIPKTVKFKLNLKTIPRYLDILQSQDNTQKIQASIAQLWFRDI